MNPLINKLCELSSSLDKYSANDYFQLDTIKNVIKEVTKSFSGSWLGYHSQIYYEDFEVPPAGAIFSVEWGLENRYGISNGTVGDWCIYNYDDVTQYIYDSAKLDDLEQLKKISSDVKDEFIGIKESLLSIISIDNSSKLDDAYYQKMVKEIEHIKLIQSTEFLSHISPKGSFVSRDSRAMMNGTKTPAHISLLCQIVELEDPVRCCKELNTSIKKLITHYSNKELLSMPTNKTTISDKVFIVHGHDDLAKTEVARFIEKLGLEAVILHEQVDAGSTIIEKLEKNTDVGFGVILYTACDFGGSNKVNQETKNNRARQNVVFEHGYLIAKLGRSKVCALVKDNVEHPSDLNGVVYKPMDNGKAWELQLAKELKAAGFDIDLNKCI
jgi:predicted nucleotide-binding protein